MNEADIELERADILRRAVAFFKQMSEVNGIFLAGSMATEQFDSYSDIDLRVVVNHSSFASVIAGKKEYPEQFGALLFNEYSQDVDHICVSHFKPFNKLDVVYLRDDQLAPNYWYGLPIKIYHDPLGFIRTCSEASRSISWESPFIVTAEAINIGVNKTIAYLFEVLRKLRRRDVNAAKDLYIAAFHLYIKELIDLSCQDGLLERFYQLTGELMINRDIKSIFITLGKIVGEIHQNLMALCTRYELNRNTENHQYCFMVMNNWILTSKGLIS